MDLKFGYISSLNLAIERTIDDIHKIKSIIDFNDIKNYFYIIIIEISKSKLKINFLQKKINEIKKYILDINYKNDVELRLKVGNLITEKILKEYYNNLKIIKKNEYLLGISIENIENKINKLSQTKNIKTEDLNILKEKYTRGLL